MLRCVSFVCMTAAFWVELSLMSEKARGPESHITKEPSNPSVAGELQIGRSYWLGKCWPSARREEATSHIILLHTNTNLVDGETMDAMTDIYIYIGLCTRMHLHLSDNPIIVPVDQFLTILEDQ